MPVFPGKRRDWERSRQQSEEANGGYLPTVALVAFAKRLTLIALEGCHPMVTMAEIVADDVLESAHAWLCE